MTPGKTRGNLAVEIRRAPKVAKQNNKSSAPSGLKIYKPPHNPRFHRGSSLYNPLSRILRHFLLHYKLYLLFFLPRRLPRKKPLIKPIKSAYFFLRRSAKNKTLGAQSIKLYFFGIYSEKVATILDLIPKKLNISFT